MSGQFKILKNAKKFSKSSQKWLRRQINDPFVVKAKSEGWRSRSAFKIIEIDKKFKIFKKNQVVVDLGASPGGWSQFAVKKVGEGRVVAIDLLPFDKIAGVEFVQCDFLADESKIAIIDLLKKIPHNQKGKCNVVMSDMASNATGNNQADHLRIINLLEDALDLAVQILNEKGCFIGKIFQGGSSKILIQQLQKHFNKIHYFKPDSSRKDSSEFYLIALGYKGEKNI
ncbi:MAG: RlmE family RNA methyltransferase [Rickettsiales bacterium]|nr:RlmE family RNA methyltransferase [Rickettsiales bacterium]